MISSKRKKDLTVGPIFSQMLFFVIPIMLSSILQVVYHMADHIVVGQFSGDEYALAAVGSTGELTNFVVNLLIGISTGSSVIISHRFGAKEYDLLEKAVHTSLSFSLIGGIAFSAVGLIISRPALILLGTKEVLLDKAVLYLRIIFLGVPAGAVYNYGAGILRAVGDSKSPLVILSTTGLINVFLNLFFVIVCNMTVDGVAIATIASQYLSAVAVVLILIRRKGEPYRLSFKKLSIDKQTLGKIMHYGIPVGVQRSLFAISSMFVLSAVNTLPPEAVAAKTIAININSFLYAALNSYQVAAMTFSAQNYGAKNSERIKKSISYSIIQPLIIGIILSTTVMLSGKFLTGLFVSADDPNRQAITENVMSILWALIPLYCVCGIQGAFAGALNGLGHSFEPMIITLLGVGGIRILWSTFFFNLEPFHSINGLYLCYPISWFVALAILAPFLYKAYKDSKKRFSQPDKESCEITA